MTGGHMQRVAILLAALVLLGGCERELSKEKVDLLEAVMFTIEGIENNIQQKIQIRASEEDHSRSDRRVYLDGQERVRLL